MPSKQLSQEDIKKQINESLLTALGSAKANILALENAKEAYIAKNAFKAIDTNKDNLLKAINEYATSAEHKIHLSLTLDELSTTLETLKNNTIEQKQISVNSLCIAKNHVDDLIGFFKDIPHNKSILESANPQLFANTNKTDKTKSDSHWKDFLLFAVTLPAIPLILPLSYLIAGSNNTVQSFYSKTWNLFKHTVSDSCSFAQDKTFRPML